ncbi:pirin family protein [Paraburkholderia aromaticivorans]|uniref:Pirin family protein n=1 Tax=Paraburkholderia aromaticivorans TaxID=2026199 RepID=A0A248VSS3_9BURK|nr:pirin family protein [Paraburkholderia aromaticivorans]ASW01923.1 hypothetical protein CJU94_27720 [Paraburkholderia aromaticivorans]
MIEHRPFDTLGSIERGWLKASLHFRFGELGRPGHTPMGALHVWNDDEFAPHAGFDMHSHRNVEIVTYVRTGAITHADSFGNAARIEAGCVQAMSAGTGVLHSERNEEREPTRLFQIWLTPRSPNGEPRWAMRRCGLDEQQGRLVVLASGDPADHRAGALAINANARLLGATMLAGQTLVHALPQDSQAYLVTTVGRLDVANFRLAARDGIAVAGEPSFAMTAVDDTSIVMVTTRAA